MAIYDLSIPEDLKDICDELGWYWSDVTGFHVTVRVSQALPSGRHTFVIDSTCEPADRPLIRRAVVANDAVCLEKQLYSFATGEPVYHFVGLTIYMTVDVFEWWA